MSAPDEWKLSQMQSQRYLLDESFKELTSAFNACHQPGGQERLFNAAVTRMNLLFAGGRWAPGRDIQMQVCISAAKNAMSDTIIESRCKSRFKTLMDNYQNVLRAEMQDRGTHGTLALNAEEHVRMRVDVPRTDSSAHGVLLIGLGFNKQEREVEMATGVCGQLSRLADAFTGESGILQPYFCMTLGAVLAFIANYPARAVWIIARDGDNVGDGDTLMMLFGVLNGSCARSLRSVVLFGCHIGQAVLDGMRCKIYADLAKPLRVNVVAFNEIVFSDNSNVVDLLMSLLCEDGRSSTWSAEARKRVAQHQERANYRFIQFGSSSLKQEFSQHDLLPPMDRALFLCTIKLDVQTAASSSHQTTGSGAFCPCSVYLPFLGCVVGASLVDDANADAISKMDTSNENEAVHNDDIKPVYDSNKPRILEHSNDNQTISNDINNRSILTNYSKQA